VRAGCVLAAGKKFAVEHAAILAGILCAMSEIIFLVEQAPEGGYSARALDVSIFTQAATSEELHVRVRDAVRCHFESEERSHAQSCDH
jgi:hypothetical protein